MRFVLQCCAALSLSLMLLPAATRAVEPATGLRVMSFNIRYGTAQDGENHWDKRNEFLIDTIKAFKPDLLGTQETLLFQRDYLKEKLEAFEAFGVARDDGREKGEMAALFFRRDRFELLAGGNFWLSETPEAIGSKSWDSALPRIATWVKLRDRKNDAASPLLFVNTHFDHLGKQARVESARLLRGRIETLAQGCSIVATGDFNDDDGSEPYKALFDKTAGKPSPLVDSYRVIHSERKSDEGTFSGFKVSGMKGPRIDWIGVSRDWKVQEAAIDHTARDGHTPSDHFPVTAVLNH
jgi:endonuclease/exonuclease/phosphatase family metal-dependent hydrolase